MGKNFIPKIPAADQSTGGIVENKMIERFQIVHGSVRYNTKRSAANDDQEEEEYRTEENKIKR